MVLVVGLGEFADDSLAPNVQLRIGGTGDGGSALAVQAAFRLWDAGQALSRKRGRGMGQGIGRLKACKHHVLEGRLLCIEALQLPERNPDSSILSRRTAYWDLHLAPLTPKPVTVKCLILQRATAAFWHPRLGNEAHADMASLPKAGAAANTSSC